MKLAEALLLRADYQTRISELNSRVLSYIKVQENEKPNEDPEKLIKESLYFNEKLCGLIKKINKKNSIGILSNGMTVLEALMEKEMLMKKRRLLSNVVEKANEEDYRLTHSEVRMELTIDVSDMQKQINVISKAYREIDILIQEYNWTTELE